MAIQKGCSLQTYTQGRFQVSSVTRDHHATSTEEWMQPFEACITSSSSSFVWASSFIHSLAALDFGASLHFWDFYLPSFWLGPPLLCDRRTTRGGAFGAFAPPKFWKHCIAILTFLWKFSKNKDEILYSNHFKEKSYLNFSLYSRTRLIRHRLIRQFA